MGGGRGGGTGGGREGGTGGARQTYSRIVGVSRGVDEMNDHYSNVFQNLTCGWGCLLMAALLIILAWAGAAVASII
jgi:hypothetical protein